MKIALITPEYVTEHNWDGGLAGYLHRIATSLKQMGHQPVVLVCSNKDEVLWHEGVEVHRVNVVSDRLLRLDKLTKYKFPLNWIWQSWRLNARLAQLHRQAAFDVLHYSSYMATALFKRTRVPAVIRMSSLQRMLHEADGTSRVLRRRLYERLEILALFRGAILFSPSRLIAEATRKHVGRQVELVESPWTTGGLKTDNAVYQSSLAGLKYILYFGTLKMLKGTDLLALVLPGILESYPDLHFVAVGKEVPFRGRKMSDYLFDMAGRHKDRVHYLGRLDRPSLMGVVDKAFGVVLPSRIDNLPNACLEAMSLGKPVVGAEGASFEQLIVDGVSGFLFPVGDTEELDAAVRRMLDTTEHERAEMAAAQKVRVDSLAPEQVVNELLDLYRHAIKTATR